mmetsp:Transcript_16045/g.22299  ORF Transcript_16045/g.22299 Transcript_16045/m.22299 type:complete len:96 (-) Transcript_16045:124-411(-)
MSGFFRIFSTTIIPRVGNIGAQTINSFFSTIRPLPPTGSSIIKKPSLLPSNTPAAPFELECELTKGGSYGKRAKIVKKKHRKKKDRSKQISMRYR